MTKRWAQDEPKKPRLLLIDDMDVLLPKLAENFEKQGFEVVKMHLGESGHSDETMIHGKQADAIRYAINSANRIDAVVTDLNEPGGVPYGRYVVKDLKKSGFNGPIAVHSSEPDAEYASRLIEDGAIGFFSKKQPENTVAALNEALAQGKGIV